MNIQKYKEFIKTTAIYPKDKAIDYLTLGLIGEAGELCNAYKKVLRDNQPEDVWVPQIKKELGDFFWYLYQLGNEHKDYIIEPTFSNNPAYVTPTYKHLSTMESLLISLNKNIIFCLCSDKVSFSKLSEILSILIYHYLDSSIEEILQINVDKLSDRKARNVLGGSGDNR